jgi:ketosteroid isomerase-like protein
MLAPLETVMSRSASGNVLLRDGDGFSARTGLPDTGKRFEFPGVAIGRMRNGKIVETKSYWNLATYLTQLGLTLEQAAPPQP